MLLWLLKNAFKKYTVDSSLGLEAGESLVQLALKLSFDAKLLVRSSNAESTLLPIGRLTATLFIICGVLGQPYGSPSLVHEHKSLLFGQERVKQYALVQRQVYQTANVAG